MGTRLLSQSTTKGSFIGAIIGLLWISYAVSLIPGPYKYILLILGLLVTFFLLRKFEKKRNEMLDVTRLQTDPNKKKTVLFILNTLAEIIFLNIVYYYLIKIGQKRLLIPAISIIVGLHFIPMAIFLKIRQFYISSSIMIISGIIFIMVSNKLEENAVNILQSILNALALWLTVAASLKDISKANFDIDRRTGQIQR
jgi:hypothetical protein